MGEGHLQDAVLLALADHVAHLDRRRAGGLQAKGVLPRIERHGAPALRAREDLAVEQDGHLDHVAPVRPDRVEHHRGQARVHLGDPPRAVLTDGVGADGAGARHEARARFAELAVQARDLRVVHRLDAHVLLVGGAAPPGDSNASSRAGARTEARRGSRGTGAGRSGVRRHSGL